MNQRDDASDVDGDDEGTDAPDATDADRSTDTSAGDGSDGDHTSEGSDVSEDEGESDGPGAEDGDGRETSEGADGEAEETEETGDVEESEGTDESEDAEGTGETEETGEPGDAEDTEELDDAEEVDPVATSESGADDSPAIGNEPAGGVVESEVGETESTEADASSSAPARGPDEVYCQSCGEPIKAEAEVCPHCGVRQQGSPGEEKNSAVSFIASLIIPGAGQAYNEQFGRAIAMFFGAIVADTILVILGTLLSIILIGVFFFLLIPVVHVAIAYDAYNQAEKINRGEVTV